MGCDVTDRYRSFSELQAREPEGESWVLEYEPRGSRILVMAPHGGWIEPYTTELAAAIAGEELDFYSFEGIRPRGARGLHLTSHHFDEPVALKAASRVDAVLAVHGERTGDQAFVMVGGGGTDLVQAVARRLRGDGFLLLPPRPGLEGRNPENICNRGAGGGGVQLELSEGLRRALRRDASLQDAFVEAVRSVLEGAVGREGRS